VTATVLENVQAHLLRPAHPKLIRSTFHFLTIDDPDRVRSLLRRLRHDRLVISDAEAHSRRRDAEHAVHPHIAVGFTREGLEVMGHSYRPDPIQLPQGEKDPFCQGMSDRSDLLGDPKTPEWRHPHMLLWEATMSDGAAQSDSLVAESGISECCRQTGSYQIEQEQQEEKKKSIVLGFLDGTSQPFVSELTSTLERLPGGGTVTRDGWRPVPLGEFVLGSTDAGGERVLPEPTNLTAGGTFLVYRKYTFDDAALKALLGDGAHRYRQLGEGELGTEGNIAAKIMGRYRVNEEPSVWPDGYDAVIPPDASRGAGHPSRNDFRYANDSYGYSCPLGAHIRRANPRDALGFEGRLTERHRIIRRGVPWTEDGREGLHFVAVNARIHDQFEFIQRQWLNNGSSFRLGDDIDLVAGSDPKRAEPLPFVIQGTRPVVIRAPGPIARFEGGDYFLMPGMEGLRLLEDEPG
jgi:hypothetical protein